jgi:hypothetical protein
MTRTKTFDVAITRYPSTGRPTTMRHTIEVPAGSDKRLLAAEAIRRYRSETGTAATGTSFVEASVSYIGPPGRRVRRTDKDYGQASVGENYDYDERSVSLVDLDTWEVID